MTLNRAALIAWVKAKQAACEAAYRNLTYRNAPLSPLSPGAVQFRAEADHFAALHALLEELQGLHNSKQDALGLSNTEDTK